MCGTNCEYKVLTTTDVIYIHEKIISRYGGGSGLRDRHLLESALGRIETGYYDSVFSVGAALFEGIYLNHAFVDGNKRTAFCVLHVFLQLNNYTLTMPIDELYYYLDEKWPTCHNDLQSMVVFLLGRHTLPCKKDTL